MSEFATGQDVRTTLIAAVDRLQHQSVLARSERLVPGLSPGGVASRPQLVRPVVTGGTFPPGASSARTAVQPMAAVNPPEVLTRLHALGCRPEPPMLFSAGDVRHLTVRAIYQSAAAGEPVSARVPLMRTRAQQLLVDPADGGVGLLAGVVQPFVDGAVDDLFGYPVHGRNQIAAFRAALEALWTPLREPDRRPLSPQDEALVETKLAAAEELAACERYHDDLFVYREGFTRTHPAAAADSLLTRMVRARDAGLLTSAEVHWVIRTSRVAAGGLVVHQLMSAIAVALHPEFLPEVVGKSGAEREQRLGQVVNQSARSGAQHNRGMVGAAASPLDGLHRVLDAGLARATILSFLEVLFRRPAWRIAVETLLPHQA